MKIWHQNTLAIVPLFVCLAATASILVYQVVRHELAVALKDEAQSAAIAIAAQLDHGGADETVRTGVRKVLEHGAVRRVKCFRAGEPEAWLDGGDHSLALPTADDESMLDHPVILEPAMGKPVVVATAASPAGMGSVIIWLDGERMSATLAALKKDVAAGTIATVLLGFVLAGAISCLLNREIRSLGRVVVGVTQGRLDDEVLAGVAPDAQHVREFEELGNTVATMGSVLNWQMHRQRLLSKQSGTEQRSDTNPADCSRNVRAELHWCCNGIEMSLSSPCANGRFVGESTVPSGKAAFFGCVAAGVGGDELDRMVLAQAASDFLVAQFRGWSGGLEQGSVTASRAAALFHLSELSVLVTNVHGMCEVISYRSAGIAITTLSFESDRTMHVVHNGDVDLEAWFDGVVMTLPPMSAEQLRRRLIAASSASQLNAGLTVAAVVIPPSTNSEPQNSQASLSNVLSHV